MLQTATVAVLHPSWAGVADTVDRRASSAAAGTHYTSAGAAPTVELRLLADDTPGHNQVDPSAEMIPPGQPKAGRLRQGCGRCYPDTPVLVVPARILEAGVCCVHAADAAGLVAGSVLDLWAAGVRVHI